MGARPSSFAKGGGMFSGDGMITGYEFTVGETTAIKKGPRKGEPFTPLSLTVSFRMDGADEDISKRLLIGDADAYGDVTDKGHTLLTPDGQRISASGEAGVFIGSLCDGGFPETNFEDTDERINFEPMIGTRIRMVNEVDKEKTERQGKEKNAKTGKEYDRRTLRVQTVLDLPKPAIKSNGKTARVQPISSTSLKKRSEEPDGIAELAASTLLDILSEADDNSVPKAKLRMKVFAKLGTKHPQRDAVIKYLYDDANLSTIEGVSYDQRDKGQVISLV